MTHVEISINGIVQGVGFRPYIHRSVKEMGLTGTIRNTSSGVEIELEGPKEVLERFVKQLPETAPGAAAIEKIDCTYSDRLEGYTNFTILPSRTEAARNTLISPDLAVCGDCLRELNDPHDRRYHYPFINCTNCGPRFTILEDVPYDRKNTSMRPFLMCPDCSREYTDIENRRYHAQPDCCPACGPQLTYYDGTGTALKGNAPDRAREELKKGSILAIKGLGGIHLACRCDEEALVQKLRARKHRDQKPFAIMCRDIGTARTICEISPDEEKILTGPAAPIVLLKKKQKGFDYISENRYIGIMLPYTPLHALLFDEELNMLVMTSANLSDTPILFRNEEALTELRGIADGFLLHDRRIQTRCDDSVCWAAGGSEYFARRSRGYVPYPVKVLQSRGMILACGAEQKAGFCLSKDRFIFPGQHIGDLKNIETYENYTDQIRHFEHLFDITPSVVCCDLHPDYLSTAYAEQRAAEDHIPLIRVQHHHAHMAACMADNNLTGKTIGLIWDGTGLGTDGSIWGSECLVGDYAGFERFGSIRPIPLPGGDLVTREPLRAAYALLRESDCRTEGIEGGALYARMMDGGLNCPYSSGMGRLFDGIAALTGIKTVCSYEGQGAVLLEAAASETDEAYSLAWEEKETLFFDWRPMIREIVTDLDAGRSKGDIAAKFMNTMLRMGAEFCREAALKYGLDRVVLSGGSFQNMYILNRLPALLEAEGLKVYRHHRVSANDQGLALGQLLIAQYQSAENRGK